MVKTLPFGDIQVPTPGFGAMGLSAAMGSNLSYEEAEPVLLKAIKLGCTFWDTAVGQIANEHCGIDGRLIATCRSPIKLGLMRSCLEISLGSMALEIKSSVSLTASRFGKL